MGLLAQNGNNAMYNGLLSAVVDIPAGFPRQCGSSGDQLQCNGISGHTLWL
jgi:hypothetical protein